MIFIKKYFEIIKKIKYISIIKTIKFNRYYFGLKGLILCPIIISKNIELHTLKGNVFIDKMRFCGIKIGFGDIAIFDRKYDKGMWSNTGNVYFKGDARIGHGSKIFNTSELEIGDNFIISAKAEIICCKNIKFGDNCLLSWDNLIMDTDFHDIYDNDTREKINEDEAIFIGNNVWIGCKNLILKGVYIPDGSILASNSTVTKKFDNYKNILIGGKDKILKKNVSWTY